MAIAGLQLTEDEQATLEAMAKRLGRSPEELVHDAVKALVARDQPELRLGLLRQARGMWKDRTDLPSTRALRGEWDRQSDPFER